MEEVQKELIKRLPRSLKEYYICLDAAKEMKDILGPGQQVLRPATAQHLDEMFLLFKAGHEQRILAKAKSLSATRAVQKAVAKLRMFDSHFLQHVFEAIEREEVKKYDKAYYGIDDNSSALPVQRQMHQVMRTASDIIKGEAARVAAGGQPMLQPGAAQINALLEDLTPKRATQMNAKSEYNDRQEDLQKLAKEAKKVLRTVWAEVLSSFVNDPDAGSRREKAEQWGVQYVHEKRKRKSRKTKREDEV